MNSNIGSSGPALANASLIPTNASTFNYDVGDTVRALVLTMRFNVGDLFTVSSYDRSIKVTCLIEIPGAEYPASWFERASLTHNTCPVIEKHQEIQRVKCECGTDTVGGGNHSSWCPKK